MIQFFKKLLFGQKVSTKSVCSVCDLEFDEANILMHEDLPFCKEHHRELSGGEWIEDLKIICTPDEPEKALLPQEKKEELRMKGILSYIKSSYELQENQIVTTFTLMKQQK